MKLSKAAIGLKDFRFRVDRCTAQKKRILIEVRLITVVVVRSHKAEIEMSALVLLQSEIITDL